MKSPFPKLEGKRVRLREFAERDLAEFARYRADPNVSRYQSWDTYTLEDAKHLYAKQLATPFSTTGSWHQIAIADKASDALVGDCALHFLSEDELEIGFTIAPERQGRGLAREAVELLLGHMPQPRIIAVTDVENLSAQELLLSLGFRAEQTRAVVFKGKPGNERVYAIDRMTNMIGPDLDSLHRAVATLLAQDRVQKDIARLKVEIQTAPEPFVWAVVDCAALAGVLPKDIRSGWIFVLRKDTPSGAHHHPNSVQHMVMVDGAGRSIVAGEERRMQRFGAAGLAPRDLWYVIGKNVIHEFFPEGEDVVVISFHTCATDELVEIEEGSGHARRYES